MTITIKIDTGNAAFGENLIERGIEIERIFVEQIAPRMLADDPKDPHRSITLRDYDGNCVGSVKVTGR
jgi:hypothetical protein